MSRWRFVPNENKIHLAVEGSVGGTSLGLHVAADMINDGGRVLWVCEEMPDNKRFSQLFQNLSLTDASKFHAMSFSSSFDKAVDSIISALETLPSVKLIVMDDWCQNSGKIPNSIIDEVIRLKEKIPEQTVLLLISKASIDASGKKEYQKYARAENKMRENDFSIFILSRPKDGPLRELYFGDQKIELQLTEEGFTELN
ncbi:MAG: hypothetical protein CBE08_002795 [Euryarchaeota archaeon TMED248]|nr:MAG: hypothetical protein CBE08_002795 [Euryarchaeota archaeon TMED248]